jgi:predicted nucleic acid-binding protein
MVFIDTGAFLARYLERDQYHERAQRGWEELDREPYRCYTSNFVIDEFLTLLARRSSYTFAAERAHRVYGSRKLDILRPDGEDEREAVKLFEQFADQEVSFTDCVSFALMRRYRLQIAFAFDRHFRDAGFVLWEGAQAPAVGSWVHDSRRVTD